MPQYKYPVKGGAKWMTKFNYTDPKSGIVKTAYKRGFDSKREANVDPRSKNNRLILVIRQPRNFLAFQNRFNFLSL